MNLDWTIDIDASLHPINNHWCISANPMMSDVVVKRHLVLVTKLFETYKHGRIQRNHGAITPPLPKVLTRSVPPQPSDSFNITCIALRQERIDLFVSTMRFSQRLSAPNWKKRCWAAASPSK